MFRCVPRLFLLSFALATQPLRYTADRLFAPEQPVLGIQMKKTLVMSGAFSRSNRLRRQ